MQLEFQPILAAIETKQLPADFEALLGSLWDKSNSRFNTQETYVLDFKETVPPNFDEDYGIGILRLALGFYNSFGGLIVFGVRDQHLDIVGTSSWFDIETFNRTLTELAGMRAECLVRTYTIVIGEESRTLAVVLVPKREILPPAKLKRKIGKYSEGTLWVRERHEVIAATSRNFPMLYSERVAATDGGSLDGGAPVHRSFPPSPATMQEFVSREPLEESLWNWFVFGDQPRVYLHGPGGSGKSTLAFEFARKLTDAGGSIRTQGGDRLDYVIFISGKETEYNPQTGKEQAFALRQFTSASEQFAQILFHSGFLDEEETASTDEPALLAKFDELFANFSGLIVIDDIDALYRHDVDSGEEALFMKIVRGAKRTRVLYTLRTAPPHAKKSAIPVPGLELSTEFPEMIKICCSAFDVPAPGEVDTKELDRITSRLPLLMETVIGLRKFSGSYPEALNAFSERGGDDARRYLYQREYDRLDQRGKSRQLLAALALLEEPVDFSTLTQVLQSTRDVLLDAMSECGSIFLSTQEGPSGDTLYQLAPPSIPFLLTVSRQLSYFGAIEKRVLHRKSTDIRISPREATILANLERSIRKEDFRAIADECEQLPSNDLALENPKIRSLLGQAYSALGGNFREKARESFKHAVGLGFYDVFMMRRWFHMEFTSGYGLPEAERICGIVINNNSLAPRVRGEFWGKLGSCWFSKSMNVVGVNRSKAIDHLRQSIACYMEAVRLGRGRDDISMTFDWMERPVERIIYLTSNDVGEIFAVVDIVMDRKQDIDADAVEWLFQRFARSPATINKERLKGLCTRSVQRIAKTFKKAPPGFEQVVKFLDAVKTA
ncbi:RNA-binding domain-containing protein [Bradyrhizobium japonicum]|uniref:RNA-binding domain-containing protein n=1 Tax=Bradyrhizobium japonicum TaxID=375 RepID=UPI001BAC2637|nr:RNA-binding domain-containing protein [Bradyrhizobium japonicum]MBR0761564.1 hypothetical protein [Bradyrhizobium japonicum]